MRSQREVIQIVGDGKIISSKNGDGRNGQKEFSSQELDLSELDTLDLSSCDEDFLDLSCEQEDAHPFLQQAEEIHPHDFRMIEGIMISADTPYLPESYKPELPAKRNHFCPYLIIGEGSDYGSYLHYLHAEGKASRTITEYGIDLRRWKKELQGDVTIPNINHVLKRVERETSVYRASRLKSVLESYARYRNFHGDPLLLMTLSTSLTLHHPVRSKKQPRKPTDTIKAEEALNYWNLARDLVKDGKREGVWIALLLMGVNPGAIRAIEFPTNTKISYIHWGNPQETPIESWLYDACHSIEGWRVGRKVIHQGVKNHEVVLRVLNRCAHHCASYG